MPFCRLRSVRQTMPRRSCSSGRQIMPCCRVWSGVIKCPVGRVLRAVRSCPSVISSFFMPQQILSVSSNLGLRSSLIYQLMASSPVACCRAIRQCQVDSGFRAVRPCPCVESGRAVRNSRNKLGVRTVFECQSVRSSVKSHSVFDSNPKEPFPVKTKRSTRSARGSQENLLTFLLLTCFPRLASAGSSEVS